jgi:hypothetical protein
VGEDFNPSRKRAWVSAAAGNGNVSAVQPATSACSGRANTPHVATQDVASLQREKEAGDG